MNSVADEILKLSDLKDRGLLTEDEFHQQKAHLLNGGSGTTAPVGSQPSSASSGERATSEPEIPEQIRYNLKGYDKYRTVTCLECGYTGRMGVMDTIVPWYLTYRACAVVMILAALVCLVVPMGFWGGFIVFSVLSVLRWEAKKYRLRCPSCANTLVTGS
ncbi:SHOCT domain-containing protein [Dyella kyungheensis]|uniref:SHOCT domain-containing protein n=1 Tax=Dyella kyungheensis TaxID=1242174 RepID=A0ABS2JMR1_9GAMM|nr:SHOCT domain-containing protein [Dyella kyungheensis]MBM7120213.1 SHOCT domain-containing protein [Dyella kyungheensis]